MHLVLEFLAEIAAYLLPGWLQRNLSPKNQLWGALGCTLVVLAVVALVLVFFANR